MRNPSPRLLLLLQALTQISSVLCHVVRAKAVSCKSTPNDPSWPTIDRWNHLNESLYGRLLHPAPPALACHSSDPADEALCADIKTAWNTFPFHQNNPVSTAWNNINNDSCLPDAAAPCSDEGYPAYVVNASSAYDVKLAIDFARENNLRMNVKASGHDYLKRYVFPRNTNSATNP